MLLKILEMTFGFLIGRLPKEKKEKLWKEFKLLLREVAKASSEGAVRGAKDHYGPS